MIKFISYTIAFLAILSTFLYAAFDIVWWKPISGDGREVFLIMLHVFCMIAGLFALIDDHLNGERR